MNPSNRMEMRLMHGFVWGITGLPFLHAIEHSAPPIVLIAGFILLMAGNMIANNVTTKLYDI